MTDVPLELLKLLFRPHPWHGVSLGDEAPATVSVYVEIVPTDTVKYEIDKQTGFLTIDRPQKYSNVCPTLYGFLPRTYSGSRVAALCRARTGRDGVLGDEDPLDVCVLTERQIVHGDLFLRALPVGGFRMIDGDLADDKIVAVLEGDASYGGFRELDDLPGELIERLRHYFLTYKQAPGVVGREVEIPQVYGRQEAYEVIERSREDYQETFGEEIAAYAGASPSTGGGSAG